MTTAKKGQKVAPAPEETAAENTNTDVATSAQYPSWFVEKTNRRTGEVEMVPKFKYMEGMPKEYRFDGRIGTFGPVSGGGLPKIKLFPIAHRFFEDRILGQDDRKTWGEIFFVDETLAVSSILFHTHSLRNLQEVIGPLFYQDLMLEDVILTCTSEKMEGQNDKGKFTYYLAKFEIEEAPIADVDERLEFANTVRIYRRQTLTDQAVISASSRYFNPFDQVAHEEDKDEAETSAEEETESPAPDVEV